jgi:hypothetical protein
MKASVLPAVFLIIYGLKQSISYYFAFQSGLVSKYAVIHHTKNISKYFFIGIILYLSLPVLLNSLVVTGCLQVTSPHEQYINWLITLAFIGIFCFSFFGYIFSKFLAQRKTCSFRIVSLTLLIIIILELIPLVALLSVTLPTPEGFHGDRNYQLMNERLGKANLPAGDFE